LEIVGGVFCPARPPPAPPAPRRGRCLRGLPFHLHDPDDHPRPGADGRTGGGTNTAASPGGVDALNLVTGSPNHTVPPAAANDPVPVNGGGSAGGALYHTDGDVAPVSRRGGAGPNTVTRSAGTRLDVGSGSLTRAASAPGTAADLLTQVGRI